MGIRWIQNPWQWTFYSIIRIKDHNDDSDDERSRKILNNENYENDQRIRTCVSPIHIIENKVFNETRRHWSWKRKESKRWNENKRYVVRKNRLQHPPYYMYIMRVWCYHTHSLIDFMFTHLPSKSLPSCAATCQRVCVTNPVPFQLVLHFAYNALQHHPLALISYIMLREHSQT